MGASEGTQVYEDDQEITKIFGRSNMLLALYPNTSEVNERAMAKEIKDLSYVKSVTGPGRHAAGGDSGRVPSEVHGGTLT